MASPAWLPQEVQLSTSQAPDQSSHTPAEDIRTSKGPTSSSSDSTRESLQAASLTAPGYAVPAPPFSYSGQQFHPSSANSSSYLQPPVPGPSARPNAFTPMFSSPVSVPKGLSSNTPSFSYNGNTQSMQNDQSLKDNSSASASSEAGTGSSALFISQSVPLPGHTSSSSTTMNISSTPSSVPATPWIINAPSFPVIPSNPTVQHQIYHHPYPSLPAMGATPPQGLWMQPPPRPPLLPYPQPAAFSASFPSAVRHMPLPSVPLPDPQPPGVTPVVTSADQLASVSGKDFMPFNNSTDGIKHVNDVGIKDGGGVNEQLDAWTAHKSETGAVYYYNALTGESTYEKPVGFKGEADKITVQPTPVSWEKLAGTDWTLVTTNDGKKYYYNANTKLSSWQIPNEVTESRKKLEDENKENSTVIPNNAVFSEKTSTPISLSAPALNTGGRDATSLRTSGGPGTSSALDLIKRKLQESGSPLASSQTSPGLPLMGPAASELSGPRAADAPVKGLQSENSKEKLKDANDGNVNMSDSSSDSEDVESGPTKEECIIQFKEMLKERGVAPFSKWEKELPKIVFDPRFKAVPGYTARRSLFEHYVRTRAEEERKEKRAAQRAAIEGFKQLLEEAAEDIDYKMDYQTLKKKWGHDPRFEALDRKDREVLLNERVLPLKRAAEEKAKFMRAAASSSFKSMLRDRDDITASSRWSRVKDTLRNDPRYKSVKHEDREILFVEYISELKAVEAEAEQVAKAKRDEQDKLKEREREMRKRKEREEQEMERVKIKVRRKEAISSYQALLVETIKDPQASWTVSKPKLEKDPQGRATNPDLDPSDTEKLFREHVKMLFERCAHDFKALLAEVITAETAARETEDGKTVLNSWSAAKQALKPDPRYSKMPRKERESMWRRHAEDVQRRQRSTIDQKEDKQTESKSRSSGSRTHGRR